MIRVLLVLTLAVGLTSIAACAQTPAMDSHSANAEPTNAKSSAVSSVSVPLAGTTPLPRVFSFDPKALVNVRARIAAGDGSYTAALDWLMTQAERVLRIEPTSVMAKAIVPPSGDKHDYLSLAPYWWPDPSKPNGLPYIRKDGQTNPELHTVPDKDNLNTMSFNVYTLALAYYLKADARYADQAARLLRVWFLNSDTKMNPNLKHGQAVRGINDGRAEGVLETRALTLVVDAVGLLADYPGWTSDDRQGLTQWFKDYVTWMTTDPIGKEERAATNNHGTWYDVQLVSFLLFTGKIDDAKKVLEEGKSKRIDSQIESDGKQPLETERADAWHYTVFNLKAFFELATLGDRAGVDLWDYASSDGRSIRKALDYMVRYIVDEPWPHSTSSDRSWPDIYDILRQAAIQYGSAAYQQLSTRIIAVDAAEARINLVLPVFDASTTRVQPTVAPRATTAPRPTGPLVICNFEDDVSIWSAYDQSTETIVKAGETAPQGYLPDTRFFAASLNRWYQVMPGFERTTDQVKEGKSAGKWANVVKNNRIVADRIPHDWSHFQYLSFWMYSGEANKTSVTLVAYSEVEPTQQDYYRYKITLDWTGWKLFEIGLKEFTATRSPVGWNKVDSLKFASTGWSQSPYSTTLLYLDAMQLTNTRTGQQAEGQ